MKYIKPSIIAYNAQSIREYEANAWSCVFLSCTFSICFSAS